MCKLEFLFPTQAQLETSAYEFRGTGEFEIGILDGVATKQTTYSTRPPLHQSFGTFTLRPGTAVDVAEYPCRAGSAISIWMAAKGHTSLKFFQDSNPCRESLIIPPHRHVSC